MLCYSVSKWGKAKAGTWEKSLKESTIQVFFYRVKPRVKVKENKQQKIIKILNLHQWDVFRPKEKEPRDNENLSMLYHGILCPSFLIPLLSYETLESCRKPSQLIRTKRPSVSTWGSAFRLVVLKIHSYTCHCLPLEAIQSFPYFCLNWIESNWAFSRGFPSLGAAPILPFDI